MSKTIDLSSIREELENFTPRKIYEPNDEGKLLKKKTKNLPLIVQVENFLQENFEFRRNVVNEKIEYRTKIPLGQWKQANENEISRFLEHNHFKYSPTRTGSLLNSNFVQSYHPFIDYFQGLRYYPDEGSYIDKLLQNIKARDQQRFNLHFKKMLVRCIACSTTAQTTNNKFNKHVFVLINRSQSIGKSSFCRWLCPPALNEYFIENPSLNKDGKIALATSFLINLDELAGISKHDINQLKSWISMASINERLPYGRTRSFYPRRANFLGSTNNKEFLNDDTGNVRWLCFEIEAFEQGFWTEGNKNYVPVDKIWAEANYLFATGFPYELTLQEKEENDKLNRQFEEASLEEEMIVKYFERGDESNKEDFMMASNVLHYLVLNKGVPSNKLSVNKIGSKLTKLKFPKGEERIPGIDSPRKGYYIKKII